MRTATTLTLAAILAFFAGGALWSAGDVETGLADAEGLMTALRHDEVADTHATLAEALDGWGLPVVAARQRADLDRQIAAARYWRGEFGSLTPLRDDTGALIESDVDLLFIKANAAYRRADASESRAGLIAGLDEALRQYADVLRAAPGHVDAAYNYEFVARRRAIESAGNPDMPLRRDDDDGHGHSHGAAPAGDLPGGLTIHGLPGGPPAGTDMRQFQMVIPMSPDERRAVPERSGEGERPKKKG